MVRECGSGEDGGECGSGVRYYECGAGCDVVSVSGGDGEHCIVMQNKKKCLFF